MALKDLERELYKKEPAKMDRKTEDVILKQNVKIPQVEMEATWQKNRAELPGGWETGKLESILNMPSGRYNIKKVILWTVAAVSIVTIAVVSYLVYQALTLSGVSLEAKIPDKILVGAPYDFAITYSNKSNSVLKSVKISLTLPVELSFVDKNTDQRVVAKDIGDIGVGTIGQEIFRVIATGGNQSSRRLRMGMDYGTATIGSRLHKDVASEIFISGSAASLELTTSDKILSGESFEIHIPYKNLSEADFTDVNLILEFPANFTLKTSSNKPDAGTTWRLGDVKAGSNDELVIKGSVVAPANSFFDIKAALTSAVNGKRFTIIEKSKSVAVSASPLSLTISLNSVTDGVAKAGDVLNYSLSYTNNTDIGFSDVIISANLIGEMFDLKSVTSDGGFSSVSNTITWNASNVPALKVLSPGESDAVEFKITLLSDYPIKRFNDKNFTLKVDAEINSPTVPISVSADKTQSIDSIETKVVGALALHGFVLFRDASSSILNKGSMPLRVNNKTQFTVHWVLKNYATDVSGVEVRANLKPGVTGTGVMKNSDDTKLEYNDRTGEVIWKIPKILAGRGVIGPPLEAIFQIEVVPPLTLIGNYMPLVSEVSVKGTDIFTGASLQTRDNELSTELREDPTVNISDWKVVP